MRELFAAVLVASALARGEEAEAEPGPAAATLQIVSVPPGAVISIDGRLQGLAPRTASLPEGVHTLTAELGDAQVSQTFTLSAGQQRTLTLQLARSKEPRPFPTAGVLTTAGGVLALGAGLLLQLPAREASRAVSLLYQQGGGWDARAIAIEQAGLSAQTWSWICTGTGVAMLGSGLLVTALQLFGADRAPPALALAVSGEGGTLSWSGRF